LTSETTIKATDQDVAAIVSEVYDNWLAGDGAEVVTCDYDINSGPCWDFANDVVDLVLERFPGTDIEVEDYEDHLGANGLTSQSIHYYVKFGNRYFDASRPEGVPSPDFLPTCRSIRICARPLDGEDIDDDCETDDEVAAPAR
jgi:hypothetical protein